MAVVDMNVERAPFIWRLMQKKKKGGKRIFEMRKHSPDNKSNE